MNRKKIHKIIVKLITGLVLIIYFTTSGIIGINTVKAQSNDKYTVEYREKGKKNIDKTIKMTINNTNTSETASKTTQYGEKNMLTGKISGELAPHSWYLNRLNNLATAHNKKLNIFSGYRSFELQQQLFNDSNKSGTMVAPAGRSRHQAGLAVDVDSKWATELDNKELAKYGLHKPMGYENWHIEPIETRGKSTAELIVCYGIPTSVKSDALAPGEESNIIKSLMEMELKMDKDFLLKIIK